MTFLLFTDGELGGEWFVSVGTTNRNNAGFPPQQRRTTWSIIHTQAKFDEAGDHHMKEDLIRAGLRALTIR